MTALRALKAVTVCAFLVLLATAWMFHFDVHGYSQTLGSLRASFGDGAYIIIVILCVGSMVATPILGIAGIVGMASSRRLGRSGLIWGFLCLVLSSANFLLWKKYGGMPTHDSGIQAVQSTAKPAAAPNQPSRMKPAAP